MRILKRIISLLFLIIISTSYAQNNNKLFNKKRFDFNPISVDTLRSSKLALIEQAVPYSDTDQRYFYYEIKHFKMVNDRLVWLPCKSIECKLDNIHLVDLNGDKQTDIIHECDYEFNDATYTVVFINNKGKFKKISINGLITNVVFNKKRQVNYINTFLKGCCNSPYDFYYTYKLNYETDKIVLVDSLVTPVDWETNEFESPEKFSLRQERYYITKSVNLAVNSNDSNEVYFDKRSLLKKGQSVEVLGSNNNFFFVKVKENKKWNGKKGLSIYGWVRKNKVKQY